MKALELFVDFRDRDVSVPQRTTMVTCRKAWNHMYSPRTGTTMRHPASKRRNSKANLLT